jgi:tRNA dimethylallyltransferase
LDIDPVTAKKIHLNDAKRITRALEIYEITGQPPSQHFEKQQDNPAFPTKIFVLYRERKKLYERINQRVDQMITEGLIEETQYLLDHNYRDAMEDLKTLGYQEVVQYLDNVVDKDTMVEKLKMNTRRYAKRQLTWLRHQLDAQWIEVRDDDNAAIIAEKIRYSLEK